MTALSIFIYKRKSAINKKRLASGEGSSIGGASVVTFHGNVISFSNPVLDVDRQIHQHQHDNVCTSFLFYGYRLFFRPLLRNYIRPLSNCHKVEKCLM